MSKEKECIKPMTQMSNWTGYSQLSEH